MNVAKYLMVLSLAILLTVAIAGCAKESDESKPAEDVKTEAAEMNVDQLRSEALNYKKLILAKQDEITKVSDKIKEISPANLLGEEAKQLKDELAQINKSLNTLKDKFQVYYDQIKEKDGDLTGLEI